MSNENEYQQAPTPDPVQPDDHVAAAGVPNQIDPAALAYALVRDATHLNPNITPSTAVAVLELVKAEIIATLQKHIDVQTAAMKEKVEETSPSHIKLAD